ncbi:MAG: enoyl-CoA hydratase/isomerase family protein [Chloroflexi bacterium]|nr:enoyl-CoA hydratase/isomerase family protein [Chloroflexota bacterium]
MATSKVIYEKKGPIAYLTINRPEVRNACDLETTETIYQCEQDFDRDPDLKVIIMTGAGDKAFCSGMDLKAAAERARRGEETVNTPPPYMDTLKPSIAAVNGYAVAGGLGRALACDIRIASENAIFGDFEVRRGIPTSPGLLGRLIPFSAAWYMVLTAEPIPAQLALYWGLVVKVTPPAELMPTAEQLAQRLAEYPPEVLQAMKRSALVTRTAPYDFAQAYHRLAVEQFRDSATTKEGIIAFAERRKPQWETR